MKLSSMIKIFLIAFLCFHPPLQAAETGNPPSSDQVTFHATEIASDLEVDVRSSDEAIKKDLEASLKQLFMHANLENLISYNVGADESEEIGALASSMVLRNLDLSAGPDYQVEWRLIFQFWEGSEVSSRKAFALKQDDLEVSLMNEEIKNFIADFMNAVGQKAADVKIEGPANIQNQFGVYLNSLSSQIAQQNTDLLKKMVAAIPSQIEKFKEKFQTSSEQGSAAPVSPKGVGSAPDEMNSAPQSALTESAEKLSENEAAMPGLVEERNDSAPQAMAPLTQESVSQASAVSDAPKTARERLVEPEFQQTSFADSRQELPRLSEPKLETVTAAPIKQAEPVKSLPGNAPISKKVEAQLPQKTLAQANEKSPYHQLLEDYFKLEKERRAHLKDHKKYTELSRKMGKLKSQLQATGFYRLGAQERAQIERSVQTSRESGS